VLFGLRLILFVCWQPAILTSRPCAQAIVSVGAIVCLSLRPVSARLSVLCRGPTYTSDARGFSESETHLARGCGSDIA
jgi:hypothetical protein